MMTNVILKNAIELANKEIQKTVDYLTVNDDAWNSYHDFKMHDAVFMDAEDFSFNHNGANISFDSEYIYNTFYEWCDYEMSIFNEYCSIEYIDFDGLYNQLGRTSKFYLGRIHGRDLEDILAYCCEYYANSYIELSNGLVDIDESLKAYDGDIDEFIADLLAITDTLYDDVVEYVSDIVKIFNYIKNLKENQCDAFKEYVHEDWLITL